ncbi:MAG: 4-hydroxythreonine-4-phosphate dehydrogenase PdxA [Bacteroidales bacterium]|nr:4-hydroxythreonine-4-phosphate dehydrogenase PdxA [Bacteroidales bacterium]
MEDKRIRVGITQGDINGIGYEVILKTLSDPRIYENQAVIIYGSAKVAAYHKKALDLNGVNMTVVNSASEASYGKISIVNCTDDEVKVELSQSTPIAGKASFQALERASLELKEGLIDVLVTAPINKSNIQSVDFHFPGHTEYFESVFGEDKSALMLLVSPMMRVAVATGHIPLADVPAALDVPGLVSKLRILNKSLIRDFDIINPRIAVLALNPHAGDEGLIGREDKEIIAEAVLKAQEQHICCFGPISADGFFGSGDFKKYDGILAMYHDQGLIPFKALSMDSGVNFTAGLPIIRTSPDHGTAYDIAGKNVASEESFREAYYMACDIYQNRFNYAEMSKNPLRKQFIVQSGELSDLPMPEDN